MGLGLCFSTQLPGTHDQVQSKADRNSRYESKDQTDPAMLYFIGFPNHPNHQNCIATKHIGRIARGKGIDKTCSKGSHDIGIFHEGRDDQYAKNHSEGENN